MKSFCLFSIVTVFIVATGQVALGQTTWIKSSMNPVLTASIYNGVSPYGIDGAFDVGAALSPSVLYESGLYRMWYVGYEGNWTHRYTIGYAISEDGQTWLTYTKNPVLVPGTSFDVNNVWLSVVMSGSNLAKFVMYYTGFSSSNQLTLGVATSGDGINWDKYSGNPVLTPGSSGSWDGLNVWGVSVIKIETNDYRMWYSGRGPDGKARIGYATSVDALHWTKYSNNPVLSPGESGSWESQNVYVPRVVYANGLFHMFYLGNTPSNDTQIGYAYSTDGITWTKYGNNPVLRRGSPGQWDSYSLVDHCVLLVGTTLKMWYGGTDYPIWQIGLATSTLSTDVPGQKSLPTSIRLNQNYPNPFNPSTTVEYDVPARAHITLKVYNSIGQDVATLVDEERAPGSYSAVWDARGVATGTYWSRLTADGKSIVQKMILLK